jgi:hypothetical protein
MKTLRTLLAAALLAGAVGLGSPARADSGEQMIAFFEKLAAIIDSNKSNCDKMASELGKFLDDNAAAIDKAREEVKKSTPEQRKAVHDKYKARFDAAMAKVKEGAMACKDNPKVKAAIEKLHGPGEHAPR